jgi:outer membrane protein insertion porin family
LFGKIALTLIISISTLFAAEKFESIAFEGLTQISKSIALENIKFENEDSYTAEELNTAIKEFYKFAYFKDIWVTNEKDVLTFHFKEKPFISKLDVTGYKTRDDDLEALFKHMGIKKGTMYTKKKIENAKKALLIALERENYINSVVEIDVEDVSDTSVAVTFNVNKGDEIIIKKVAYKGAQNLDEGDFETVIANKEEDCCFTWFLGMNEGEMSYEQLSYDSARIKDLYRQHGYLDADVSAAFSKIDFNTHSAEVEYTITEGDQYTVNETLIYIDESIVKNDEIYPELKLEKDDIFNIAHLRKDQEFIKTKVADQGYAFAEVRFDIQPDRETKKVNLVYNVIPGDKVYINDVIITGNTRTLDRVIRRDIYLAPGDLFTLTDLNDSRNKLRRTGYFEDVIIDQRRISSDKLDLLVSVTEAPTGNLMIGGGYGSYEGWMINGSITDKNILGSGLELGFSIDYSQVSTDLSLALTNPAIMDSKYSGTFKIYSDTTELKNYNQTNGDKDIDEKGFLIGVGRGIGKHARIGANYEFSNSTITYEVDSTFNEDFTTSSITPYINYNNTDDYLLPRSGFMAGTSYKFAGVGGDAKYGLSSSYFKFFYGLEDAIDYDAIFRYKANVKILNDNGFIPKNRTFYLGGPSSLRGYESYAFKPTDENSPLKNYFSNAIELSLPLLPQAKMRWGVFYDYGMIGEDDFSKYKRSGAGTFISWNSPVGPIQFIFAEALDDEPGDKTSSFEFNLGGRF